MSESWIKLKLNFSKTIYPPDFSGGYIIIVLQQYLYLIQSLLLLNIFAQKAHPNLLLIDIYRPYYHDAKSTSYSEWMNNIPTLQNMEYAKIDFA